MLRSCKQLRDFELPRIENIHSAISQFVVFEMSAEMNNKYDNGNFGKLLEKFTPEEEVETIDTFLFGASQEPEGAQTKLDGDIDRSERSTQIQIKKESLEFIKVIPGKGVVPVVKNPKFEFVKYVTSQKPKQELGISTLNVNEVTRTQLLDPPKTIAEFFAEKSKVQLSEQDTQELIEFSLSKVFCASQQVAPLHHEYVNTFGALVNQSNDNLKKLISAINLLFQGRNQTFQPVILANLVLVFSVMYSSFTTFDEKDDFVQIWNLSKTFSKQKQNLQTKQVEIMTLEFELRSHYVWNNPQSWLTLFAQGALDKKKIEKMLSFVDPKTINAQTLKDVV